MFYSIVQISNEFNKNQISHEKEFGVHNSSEYAKEFDFFKN